MSGLVWCCGAGLVMAAWLAWTGLRAAPPHRATRSGTTRRPGPGWGWRAARAAAGGTGLGLVTGWPVAAAAGAAAGWFATDLLAPRQARQAPIERTEAIAVWAEQLRDTMAGAAGLQQAIEATAGLAPAPIRAELAAMAARARREPLGPLLVGLADRLADPTADLVCTALLLAASGEGQELGEVLSALAAAARDDATLRRHVDASRARTRTSVRIITAVAVGTLVVLLSVGGPYLAPYGSPAGQVVLAVVVACYGAGVWLLVRMGYEAPPERILSAGSIGAPR